MTSNPLRNFSPNPNTTTYHTTTKPSGCCLEMQTVKHKVLRKMSLFSQSSGQGEHIDQLASELKDQGITLNVISTYAKLSSRRIIGINWDSLVITRDDGYQEQKSMPNVCSIFISICWLRKSHSLTLFLILHCL